MRVLRDWLSWAVAWTLVVEAPMWVWIGLDVLEERVGVPVTMVGVGQRREQTLTRRELAPAA